MVVTPSAHTRSAVRRRRGRSPVGRILRGALGTAGVGCAALTLMAMSTHSSARPVHPADFTSPAINAHLDESGVLTVTRPAPADASIAVSGADGAYVFDVAGSPQKLVAPASDVRQIDIRLDGGTNHVTFAGFDGPLPSIKVDASKATEGTVFDFAAPMTVHGDASFAGAAMIVNAPITVSGSLSFATH